MGLSVSFLVLGKFSALMSSDIFSGLFVSFWDPYGAIVGVFNVVPEVSDTLLISFILFSSFCYAAVISNTVFQLNHLFFCLSYSAINSF